MLLKQSRDVPTTGPLQVPVIGIRQMRQAGVARKRYLRKLGAVAQEDLALTACVALVVQGTPIASEQV